MPLPDTLLTTRLCLRAPAVADALALYRSHALSDELVHLLAWQAEAWVQATRDSIEDALRRWSAGDRPYAITRAGSGEVIGMLDVRVAGRELSLGYVMAQAERGQGLMSEALSALVDAAFDGTQFDRITAHCEAGNRASAAVLVKCGFVREAAVHADVAPEPLHRYATVRRSPAP